MKQNLILRGLMIGAGWGLGVAGLTHIFYQVFKRPHQLWEHGFQILFFAFVFGLFGYFNARKNKNDANSDDN